MSAHTAQTELKLIGKLILEGELCCESGLHIGAGKGSLEIGGADNPVVKDSHGRPYVPGSTLRDPFLPLTDAEHQAVAVSLADFTARTGVQLPQG